jgi:hypothetical protein
LLDCCDNRSRLPHVKPSWAHNSGRSAAFNEFASDHDVSPPDDLAALQNTSNVPHERVLNWNRDDKIAIGTQSHFCTSAGRLGLLRVVALRLFSSLLCPLDRGVSDMRNATVRRN